MKKLFLFLALLLGLTMVTGCGQEKQSSVPRVGMDAAYPPFGFQNMDTKEYEGFDVDIIKAIAKEEGLTTEIRNVNFDGLIPALKSGDLDAAINDITVTEVITAVSKLPAHKTFEPILRALDDVRVSQLLRGDSPAP